MTHSQWIYRCVLVHDHTTGTLISSHKAKLLKEIDHQLTLGPEGLSEEDRFLLECNFDKITSTAGKQQEYWLLAIKAAQEAARFRAGTGVSRQYCISDPTWRRAYCKYYAYKIRRCLESPGDLNTSQEDTILDGESTLSAVPTATLLRILCWWRMKTPFG